MGFLGVNRQLFLETDQPCGFICNTSLVNTRKQEICKELTTHGQALLFLNLFSFSRRIVFLLHGFPHISSTLSWEHVFSLHSYRSLSQVFFLISSLSFSQKRFSLLVCLFIQRSFVNAFISFHYFISNISSFCSYLSLFLFHFSCL